MRYITIPLIFLMWGCSAERIIDRTIDNVIKEHDSVHVAWKPTILITSPKVTQLIGDSSNPKKIDSATIALRYFNSLSGIRVIVHAASNTATVEQDSDTVKAIIQEREYFKWLAESKSETKTVGSDDFFSGITLKGIIYTLLAFGAFAVFYPIWERIWKR